MPKEAPRKPQMMGAVKMCGFGAWSDWILAAIAPKPPKAMARWRTDPGFNGHGDERRAMPKHSVRQILDDCTIEGRTMPPFRADPHRLAPGLPRQCQFL